MNYFEIINLCLEELSFKLAGDFSELVKPDHKRIMSIVNRVNEVVLSSYDWPFLSRKMILTIPPNTSIVGLTEDSTNSGAETADVLRPIYFKPSMRVKEVRINDSTLQYDCDYAKFLNGKGAPGFYSIFDGKLLINPDKSERSASVLFLTNSRAANMSGEEIDKMTVADDVPLIPSPFGASVLVFGTCMQFKSNPEHPKFKYWNAMYNTALADLRREPFDTTIQAPTFSIARGIR